MRESSLVGGLVLCILGLVTGCISPTYPSGQACAPNGWCPPGQTCEASSNVWCPEGDGSDARAAVMNGVLTAVMAGPRALRPRTG